MSKEPWDYEIVRIVRDDATDEELRGEAKLEEDEICKENCGPCQNGDHKHCQLTECDCE